MSKWLAFRLLLLSIPTLLVVAVVVGLMSWSAPTRVKVDLTVSHASFTVAHDDAGGSTDLLHPVDFSSVSIEHFDSVVLHPEVLELADPKGYEIATDEYSDSAWTHLTFEPPVRIVGVAPIPQPTVTFESGPSTDGRLDTIGIHPGTHVSLEVRGHEIGTGRPPNLSIELDENCSTTLLTFHKAFKIVADNVRLENVARLPYVSDSLTYRAQLPSREPHVKVEGSKGLILSFPPAKEQTVLVETAIPVQELDFRRVPTTSDEAMSSLLAPAVLRYVEFPKLGERTIEPPDFIRIDSLSSFYVKRIALDQRTGGIELHLEGVASEIASGSVTSRTDHNLSRFDMIWHDYRVTLIFFIAAWTLAATSGLYGLISKIWSKRV